ncbi:MAG: hypothetical protein GY931_00365 [Maribacter sp.]|nr:hypothetical protein [Maribacter sp.]
MEHIIKYKKEGSSDGLYLSDAIKNGLALSKKSLINYLLTNNTNSVFPVVDSEKVVPIYPISTFREYRNIVSEENDSRLVNLFEQLLIDNIRLSGRHKSKALLLSGGIDSILIAGILKSLYGTENLRFYHMMHGDFTKGETERARRASEVFGVKLIEINKGKMTPEDYLDPVRVNGHSVDLSSPSYLEICGKIEQEQGNEVDVFNGELNLIDVGFSESSDPTRTIRRFLFNNIKATSLISSIGLEYDLPKPSKNKYLAVIQEIASMVFRKSNKRQFIAGFYTGKAHFPGFFGWENVSAINHQGELDNFFDFIGYQYEPDFESFLYQTVPAFYAGTTNVETIGSLIQSFGMNYVMPYSSPEIAGLSLNLPDKLKNNKVIQKHLAVEKYDIPNEVAYYLKNHAGYNETYASHFDENEFSNLFQSIDFISSYNELKIRLKSECLLSDLDQLGGWGIRNQLDLRTFIGCMSYSMFTYK